MLVERTTNPVVASCGALMARGVTGPFETCKPGIDYPCMRGDIEATAGFTIKEPDKQNLDCRPRFVTARQWGAPSDENAPPLHRTRAPASDSTLAGTSFPGSDCAKISRLRQGSRGCRSGAL